MSSGPTQTAGTARVSPVLIGLIVMAVFALIVVAALAFISGQQPQDGDTVDTGAALVGPGAYSTGVTELEPKAVDPFTLQSAGGPVTLETLRGGYTLIYFGYTYCPDFCPSTMTDWRVIRRALGEDADDVTFMLVSVDPARDTPDVLQSYVAHFDPAIIAATGDDASLTELVEQFGAFYDIVEGGEAPFYIVSHTTSQFLVDPNGNFIAVYAFGTPVDVIVADLQSRLQQ
ncbi:MAG: SCO family protein [Chloroflexi bacterium]|nr:SCO family protein [Chloroflexota bacterium]